MSYILICVSRTGLKLDSEMVENRLEHALAQTHITIHIYIYADMNKFRCTFEILVMKTLSMLNEWKTIFVFKRFPFEFSLLSNKLGCVDWNTYTSC